LYFALLLKKAQPSSEVVVYERNPRGATYGWGVVFSDRTLTSFREADYRSYDQITDSFIIWDAIDVRYRGRVVRCGGQVFSGIARKALLGILQRRCDELGVTIQWEREVAAADELGAVDLVVAADGVRSTVREAHPDSFKPNFSHGRSRYIWFGTRRVFDSFTFCFRENEHGFFQAHAYPFDGAMSTFIVECDDSAWEAARAASREEAPSLAYCEELFADDLGGHNLESNNSKWIRFVTLKNRKWHHDNVVLLGDAAHTAHFSIGSGTKLAMEDSIALAAALQTKSDIRSALVEYELERKPRVERFQEAARQSQEYFENTAAYRNLDPLEFSFNLLSRSGRIDYSDLRLRDPHFVADVDRTVARCREVAFVPPPSFAPFSLRGLKLTNRLGVVAPPSYSALDGKTNRDSLAGAARSGAALVFTQPVAVSEHGRITPGCAGLYTDAHTEAWREAAEQARESGDVRLVVTLNHSGPRGSTRRRDRGADIALPAQDGWTPVAARGQTYSPSSAAAAALDASGKDEVKEAFVRASRRAAGAGFDVLELHMGHGYLLGTFLSPLTNGAIDRTYPLAVLKAVRGAWDGPLCVAMNASDWARGGISLDDAVETARALRDAGCDLIRVVAGQTVARHIPRYDPYFLTHYAERVRLRAGPPTIATGDITTVDRANTLVAGGRADLCLIAL